MRVSDSGLSAIAAHCAQIEFLDLHGCTEIGEPTLIALDAGCSRLRKSTCNLSGCKGINDEARRRWLSALYDRRTPRVADGRGVIASDLPAPLPGTDLQRWPFAVSSGSENKSGGSGSLFQTGTGTRRNRVISANEPLLVSVPASDSEQAHEAPPAPLRASNRNKRARIGPHK